MGNKVSTLRGDDAEVKKFNMFTASDVREWSIYFKTKYPERIMVVDDFVFVFKYFFNEDVDDNDIKLFCNQLFNTINISESGVIDFNEIMIGFSIIAKGSFLEKVKWLFRFYDINKDGVISKDEFIKTFNIIQKITGEVENDEEIKNIFGVKEMLNFSEFEQLCKNSSNFKKISTFYSNI